MNPTSAAAERKGYQDKLDIQVARGRTELAPTLVCKHSGHETTTEMGGSELGRDDGRKRIVTADSDAHDESPDDEDANDADGVTLTGKCLTEGGHDDEHELDTVFAASQRISRCIKTVSTYTCASDRQRQRANRREADQQTFQQGSQP